MTRTLRISVHFHDDRYHGSGDWPPSPARLFQALIAAVALPKLDTNKRDALKWLETLDAPTIAAPAAHNGQNVNLYVPNNDLDAKGGDIRRIAEVRRATKRIRPRLFDTATPLIYLWRFDGDDGHAKCICDIANGLYQLGRGVDMAWATGNLVDATKAEEQLHNYPGAIYRPSQSGKEFVLDCPVRRSLDSLEMRHQANAERFSRVNGNTQFASAPRPFFHPVAYNCPSTYRLFELRHTTERGAPFATWPLNETAALTQILRGSDGGNGQPESGAFARLVKHFKREVVEKILIGRNATEADKAQRVRIIPLPSIGHVHADPAIRRVLVEVPPNCPIQADDVAWSFTGLEITAPVIHEETGEVLTSPVELVGADDRSMLTHYGVEKECTARLWHSITPLALPERAARRRIDPNALNAEAASRLRGEPGAAAKTGSERAQEEAAAIRAVQAALRHAGVASKAFDIHVQREPFDRRGLRAETFAPGTRFPKERLWHVALRFERPVAGPLLLGDGRYLGLGLMAPPEANPNPPGVFAFHVVSGLKPAAVPEELTSALRRTIMALVQNEKGPRHVLEPFFTGHDSKDGSPLREGNHRHLSFATDLKRKRLLVIAPHALEHRTASKEEQGHLKLLDGVLSQLERLRAGPAGLLTLKPVYTKQDEDPLCRASQTWESVTPYRPNRHPKKTEDAEIFVKRDLLETVRPYTNEIPAIEILRMDHGPRGGLTARLRLRFQRRIQGPLLLGRDRHNGGGLFEAVG